MPAAVTALTAAKAENICTHECRREPTVVTTYRRAALFMAHGRTDRPTGPFLGHHQAKPPLSRRGSPISEGLGPPFRRATSPKQAQNSIRSDRETPDHAEIPGSRAHQPCHSADGRPLGRRPRRPEFGAGVPDVDSRKPHRAPKARVFCTGVPDVPYREAHPRFSSQLLPSPKSEDRSRLLGRDKCHRVACDKCHWVTHFTGDTFHSSATPSLVDAGDGR